MFLRRLSLNLSKSKPSCVVSHRCVKQISNKSVNLSLKPLCLGIGTRSASSSSGTPAPSAAAAAAAAAVPAPLVPSSPPVKGQYIVVTPYASERVLLITLSRPEALNALCDGLVKELNAQLKKADDDDTVNVIVITGSEKAFAAGADIKEMSSKTFAEASKTDMLAFWHDITQIRKPIIAAVNGFALGGGCELAMMCDIIIAGDNAKFGQPEVTIGTIPGCGGTQRLTRAIGKSRSMELILSGDRLSASEALSSGLVSRVVSPASSTVNESLALAAKIASFSRPIVAMAKEAVNVAYESTLSEGVRFERRVFHATFATQDQKEGMKAFATKTKAKWNNQ